MINNKMACELSNSDHLQHPEDLKARKDCHGSIGEQRYHCQATSVIKNFWSEINEMKMIDKQKEDAIDGGVIYNL